jgi:maltose alpha-D-glucosyltransferase / alpha-amylase
MLKAALPVLGAELPCNGVIRRMPVSPMLKQRIYIPQDPDPNRPTMAKQNKDPNSQLNYVRQLLELRASSDALGKDGEWKLVGEVNKPYPMIHMRFTSHEKYVILINPSGNRVKAGLTHRNSKKAKYIFGKSQKCTYKTGKDRDEVSLPPVPAALFKLLN